MRYAQVAGGAFAIFAVIVVIMIYVDAAVMAWQRQLPRDVIVFFAQVTEFGRAAWLLIPLALMMLLIASMSSPLLGRMSNLVFAALVARIGYLFVAIGLPSLVVTITKRLIGRVRPSELGPLAFEPMSWRAAYASLPSGHATTAFAALVAIGYLWPRMRPVLWVYALLIAASRVVLRAHFPSDVIAGAACGAIGAWLVREWFAARRLGFVRSPDGGIVAFPGPSLQRLKRVAGRAFGH
ncbi:MAG: phosphatase PAP2 family protein [Proteobacteria bacterium]|nr:phosphatase PAP2 family protein [Pseudomonadota bacterium]